MADRPTDALVRAPETLLARPIPRTREARPEPQHSGLNRKDILIALFKHKKKIIFTTALGVFGAAAVYLFYPRDYQSQAKLLVRYLVERSTVDGIDPEHAPGVTRTGGENVIQSEVEILSSWDLAVQAADAVGPKRLLPGVVGATKESAAGMISSGLKVYASKDSNIIYVYYTNRDPELATLVLNEVVNRYFNKHLEVHRSAGAFDFVTQQTDQVRSRLNQTEDALKDLKEKAGIVSLADSTAALSTEAARTEEALHGAEAELAEQQARIRQLGGSTEEPSGSPKVKVALPADGSPPEVNTATKAPGTQKLGPEVSVNPEPPSEVLQQYQVLVSRLPQLRQAKLDLLAKYMPQNQMVLANQAEIDDVENQRRALEKKYPDLPARVAPIGSSKGQLDPGSETAHLAGLQAKKDALAARLKDVQARIQQLSQLGPQIADLERQKQLEENNYKYFAATLEKARVDEALDPSKIPNISVVQRPSPPIFYTKRRNKLAMALAGAGLAVGVAFALFKELILDQSVRRAIEIERFVGVSPLASIPYNRKNLRRTDNRKNQRRTGSNPNGSRAMVPSGSAAAKNLAPWDTSHFIRPYCEAIRDRIGLYFELHNLTHKPKLVGVTGFSESAGTSTLAAGLAAALSETGDGKVLLVDVSLGPEDVHPFFRGRPAYPLKIALQPAKRIDAAADNLYLATVGSATAGPAQLGLKKFFDLMPNLRASDFDYIIFDMPPLGQTSPTLGMAGFMDKLLLVVEAEQNNRDVVRRGYSALVGIRNNVSVVLNKARSYAPKWAEPED
jgi:polysaccharide biosynthesis transport protein